jgi:hypothetical protein
MVEVFGEAADGNYQPGDVREVRGQSGKLAHQDGAIEAVAREDGLKVLWRMRLRVEDVGIDAQERARK